MNLDVVINILFLIDTNSWTVSIRDHALNGKRVEDSITFRNFIRLQTYLAYTYVYVQCMYTEFLYSVDVTEATSTNLNNLINKLQIQFD